MLTLVLEPLSFSAVLGDLVVLSPSLSLSSEFKYLRREITADVKKQHDLYVKNLVGDIKANPRDFYRYINSQMKDTQGYPSFKQAKWQRFGRVRVGTGRGI